MDKDLPNLTGSEIVKTDRGGVLVPKLHGQYHHPDSLLVVHMLQELHYLVTQWQSEIAEINSKINQIIATGPVVAGWMEVGNEQIDEDYQLCILDENGKVAARDCPPTEMFGISKALARHRQLRALQNRKESLEAYIKHSLASLVQLRMDVN